MAEKESYESGTPCWVDLGTPDPAGGKAFYTGLFGWEAADEPAGEMGTYTMFRLRGKDVAALHQQREDQVAAGLTPTWLTYVSVDDVDDVAAKVPSAGGTLLGDPFDVMDNGRMAMVVDRGGAVLALWQPMSTIGAQIVNEPGSIIWNELATRDTDAAVDFYGDVLGWSGETADMDGARYTTFQVGDRPVAGMLAMGEEWGDVPPHWMTYFAVSDVDATVAKVTELGGAVMVPPTDMAVGRFAVVSDPQGATFSVMRMSEPPA